MRILGAVLSLVVLATGCSVGDRDEPERRRAPAPAPAAVLAAPDVRSCVQPGRHLYFQLVRVRERSRISYLKTGVVQRDLAKTPGVQTLRLWVAAKPAAYKPTGGTRSWPYGMGPTAVAMTGWGTSWDPLPLPDEKPRYLERGWHYVFVLLEGRNGGRADIRLGWESASRHQGELRLGRLVKFHERCR